MPHHTNLGFVADDSRPEENLSNDDYNRLHISMQRNATLSRAQDYGQDILYAPRRLRTAYISVAILFLINLINYMDRYTIAGVLDEVQSYYSLSNEEGGLLQTSFVVSYMIMAPIFGYLGDRYNRKNIMVFGVIFWSITTLLGSFVPQNHFGIFVLLRMLVGTGEASYSTIAPTIIGDLFTKERRSRMLAIFFFAIPLGSGLGYIIGSQVAKSTGIWQWSLRITPVIGIISIVLALFFLREPPRGESEGGSSLHSTSLISDLKSLSKIPTFVWSTLGFTCVTFATGALAWWAPKYMQLAADIRSQSDDISLSFNSSLIFGAITCVAGILGVLLGVTLSQRLRPTNPRADPLICAYGVLGCIPLAYAGIVIADRHLTVAWILIFLGEICLCVNWTLVTDMLLYVVIPTRRSMAQAVQILIAHALGDAASPYICGKVADTLITNPESDFDEFIGHQYSLYIPISVLVLGGLFFFMAAFHIEKDKAKCSLITHGVLSSLHSWHDDDVLLPPQPVQLAADAVVWPNSTHAYPV